MKNIILILIVLINTALFSEDYLTLFPELSEEDVIELQDKNYLLNSDVNYKEGLKLIPSEFVFKRGFSKSVSQYNPDMCVEMLFVFDKPDVDDSQLTTFLQENMLAVSDQVGIEYFSHNRNKMHPLIKKSYHVNNSKEKKKLEDPRISEITSSRNYTVFQEDTTFGGNYYNVASYAVEGEIWNQQDNINNLTVFFFFKALDKNSLRVSYIIKPVGEKVIMYSLVQIKEPPKQTEILGYKVNIADSTRKRIEAVIKWYIKRIKGN